MSHARIPVFAYPFRLGSHGEFTVVEQDSEEDIVTSVSVLVRTARGQRIDLPEYGVSDMTFAVGVNRNEILAAVSRWEPRASAIVGSSNDALDVLIQRVNIDISERRR
jgi:hypothetical protein